MTLYKWSQTPEANATADSTINWAEGQSPSSVNDSARGMMVATAKYRDDIAGAIVTGGASTAYTVSSHEVFDALARLNGAMIAFTPHVTNGATVTLNVDSLGARPLRPAPGVDLLAGTLIAGTPYLALYNHSDQAFYLHGFFGNPYNIPLGGAMMFFGTTAPNSSFVFPYGQSISRVTYPGAFTLFGTTYGIGDGSTTFGLPDLRGRVPAGKDDMGGSAASRLTSTHFGSSAAALGAVGGLESNNVILTHNHTGNTGNDTPDHTHIEQQPIAFGASGSGSGITGSSTTGSSGGASTRHVHPFTTNNTGSASTHNIVQPTIICNYILRVI